MSTPGSPPFVGALLRLGWQRVRRHINDAVRKAGFDDLQDAHLQVFSYPAPDDVRPSELARRLNMSRQAANYLLSQLEDMGYLERRDAGGQRRVFLTRRGHRVVQVLYTSLRGLQDQWSREFGGRRFADFMDVLRAIAAEGRTTT